MYATDMMVVRRKQLLQGERKWIHGQPEICPEITLLKLQDSVAERSLGMREVKCEHLVQWLYDSLKKMIPVAGEHDGGEWLRDQGEMDADQLVFVKETSIKTDLAPSRGQARETVFWLERCGEVGLRSRQVT